VSNRQEWTRAFRQLGQQKIVGWYHGVLFLVCVALFSSIIFVPYLIDSIVHYGEPTIYESEYENLYGVKEENLPAKVYNLLADEPYPTESYRNGRYQGEVRMRGKELGANIAFIYYKDGESQTKIRDVLNEHYKDGVLVDSYTTQEPYPVSFRERHVRYWRKK
jgi:hypothetical protein